MNTLLNSFSGGKAREDCAYPQYSSISNIIKIFYYEFPVYILRHLNRDNQLNKDRCMVLYINGIFDKSILNEYSIHNSIESNDYFEKHNPICMWITQQKRK